jgi:hypothetical protein
LVQVLATHGCFEVGDALGCGFSAAQNPGVVKVGVDVPLGPFGQGALLVSQLGLVELDDAGQDLACHGQ